MTLERANVGRQLRLLPEAETQTPQGEYSLLFDDQHRTTSNSASSQPSPVEVFEDEVLGELLWSPAVALDPKHRPQTWDRPAGTVRRSWCKYPQEAHLVDVAAGRYRRLTVDEIALIQGFEPSWFEVPGVSTRSRIKAIGDAVPPPLARAILQSIDKLWSWNHRTAVEICAGSGGLASGACEVQGMEHLGLIEMWEPACQILRHSKPWPADWVACIDARAYDFASLRGQVGLLSGGPPCQPWSLAGHHKGVFDPRDLLAYIHEIVGVVEPEVFLFENVPGLASEQNRDYLQAVIERLRCPTTSNVGYSVMAAILNAADFGVPQVRRRVFLLGVRDAPASLAYRVFDRVYARATHRDPTHAHPHRQPWVTLRDVLGSRPDPGGWRRWLDSSLVAGNRP